MLHLIVAFDKQRAIGFQQQLPWHLPLDLKWFRELTWGQAIVVGRKTFQSFPGGKPLPNRRHYIVSRHWPQLEGCHQIQDLESWVEAHAGDCEPFWVVGGEAIYRSCLPWASELVITHVETVLPQADAYFPEWSPQAWVSTFEQRVEADERHPYAFVWKRYERKVPLIFNS